MVVALSWLLGNGGVEVVMMMVEVLVGGNWELSVPVVAAAVVVVVVASVVVVVAVVVVAIVVVVVVVGSLPRKRGNNTAGSSVVLVVAAAVGLVGLGRGLMMVVEVLVVVVLFVGGGGGADAVVVTLRALTLFAAVSGANVGRSILTCWADEGVVGNPLLLLLLLLVVDDDESASLSLSPKPSSSKSASKSLDGVVLPPAAPPAGRLPASTLLSRPGPATRITCAIMRLTIESISCRWGGKNEKGRQTDIVQWQNNC